MRQLKWRETRIWQGFQEIAILRPIQQQTKGSPMKFLKIINEVKDGVAEMFLFGTIGEDLQCEAFCRELKELAETNNTIVIHINSGGGSVFDGLAIYGALKNCKAETIGKIDGLCASMATVVALGMTKLYMCKSAQFMTHKASGWAAGSSDELKTYASMMDNLELVMCDVYSAKTGLSSTEVKSKFLQSQDQWFSANEALTAKLIDGVYDNEGQPVEVPTAMKGQKDLIAFYNSHIQNFKSNMKQFIMSAGQLASLGLKPDSDAAAVTAAVDGLISKSKKVDQLQTDLDAANAALATEKGNTITARVADLLDKALNTDKKITAETANVLKVTYAKDPEGLDTLLKSMVKIPSVTDNLKEGEDDEFKGTWQELDKAGKLDGLKAKNLDLFKAKYKKHFGKDYSSK
jgi:ATP-dependent protease ClpP protease subunit